MVTSGDQILVREEELDWVVYHRIGDDAVSTVASIAQALGCSECEIDASCRRLEKNLLIERAGEGYRRLSFVESLASCQMRYCSDMPVYMENGVIKVKPGYDK